MADFDSTHRLLWAARTQQSVSVLALFASLTTLLCCALPIVMVSLGFGAAVAALTTTLPIISSIEMYRPWVFGISALLLAVTAAVLWLYQDSCPADAELGAICTRARRMSRFLLGTGGVIWVVGFLFAYLALPIRLWLDALSI